MVYQDMAVLKMNNYKVNIKINVRKKNNQGVVMRMIPFIKFRGYFQTV